MKEKTTVLLVEDNPDDAALIIDALGDDCETHRISDGEKALRYLLSAETMPDVCLIDNRLPSMNGIEIIERVCREREDFVCAALTIDDSAQTVVRAMKAGAVEYYVKSGGYEDLPETVEKLRRLRMEKTKSREYKQRLEDVEKRFTGILNNLIDVFFRIDSRGIVETLSPSASAMFGVKREDYFAGKSFAEAFQSKDDFNAFIARAIRHKKLQYYHVDLKRVDDKKTVYAEINAAAQFGRDGEVLSIEGVIRDVGERIKSKNELLRQKRFFEEIFLQSTVGMQIIDRDGWVSRVNPKFTEIFGISDEDIRSAGLNILSDQIMSRLGMGGVIERVFFENRKAEWDASIQSDYMNPDFAKEIDSDRIWLIIRAFPLVDQSDNIVNVVISYEDITHKKLSEEKELREKEKLEEAGVLKTIILGNLGHELRTPLNGILGFSKLLKKEAEDPDTLEMLSMVEISAERLSKTLNSLLALTELESNQFNVNFEETDIIALIKTYFYAFEDNMKPEVIFSIVPLQDSVICYTDENLFNQIIFNLVDNAVKYTTQGTIKIVVDKISILGKKWCVVRVSDTGVGIARKNLDNIFEAFRQGSEGVNRTHEGVGLGLTVTKKMIELLNGRISVESEVGKGSTFTIMLPMNKDDVLKRI